MAIISRYLMASLMVAWLLSSCQPSKKVHQDRLYLKDIDSTLPGMVAVPEAKIQKADNLSIIVYSESAEGTSLYNLGTPVSSTSLTGTGSVDAAANGGGGGYLVDGEGNILMRGLGPVHAEGLTKLQLKQLILQKLDTFLTRPYVEIRFLNKRVTMLGEVARPGIINMPEQRLNLLDAIAMSGDLTGFGRKDNILVVREENGKRTSGRLDIRDARIYKSPFFYLQKDDMVYVEPIRQKPTGTDQTLIRNISLAASLISVLAILYSVFRNN